MKTKIITKLVLHVKFDDGNTLTFPFDEKLGRFDIDYKVFSSNHQVNTLLKVTGATEERKIAVSYIYDGDYETRYFFFPIGESLTIEDHMEVNTPKFEEKIQHVSLILESKEEEIELDPNELYLQVEESAHGLEYRSGDRKEKIKLEEGLTFESNLLREKQDQITVKKIDGENITLGINSKECKISPIRFYHHYEYGGYNTRYDYEFWERFFSIRLLIPGAIQIKKGEEEK